ncbi:unnamed protein product, partial [marine sediment metagenome]
GHIDLVVTYPNGTKESLTATSGQDLEATPGNGRTVQFNFISSQEGAYSLEATLSSAGQILDSVVFELVATGVIIPGATIVGA